MKWVSAVSEHRLLPIRRGRLCASEIESALDGETPDLTVAFVSVHHSAHYDALPGLMRELFRPHLFLGCSGGGIIGAGREVENRPGFSLAAAVLPIRNWSASASKTPTSPTATPHRQRGRI